MRIIKKIFIMATLITMPTFVLTMELATDPKAAVARSKANVRTYTISPASLAEVRQNLPAIIRLSRTAFLKNHEITAHYFQKTTDALKPEFEKLFDEHVEDMMQEIDQQNGIIFLVKNSKNDVVGISCGRPYGCPALSHDFMGRVFASETHFKEVMKGWWNLMEKYQANPEDCPTHVYHQAMTAIAPEEAGQGIGTQLSKVVMKEITQRGFKALVRETSSTPAHKVAANLHDACHVVTVDEQMNEATNIPLVLRVQFINKDEETRKIVAWFESKKKIK